MADVQSPWDIQDLDTTGAFEQRVAVALVVASATGPVLVDGSSVNGLEVDVTQVQGTVTVDLAGNNDVIVAGTDAFDIPLTADPVFIGAFASDAVPTPVSADGDAIGVWASREGAVRVTLTNEAGGLDIDQPVDIASSVVLTVDLAGNNDVVVQGTDAFDAPLTADPVFVGGFASAAVPTPVGADGDAIGLWLSRDGAARVTLTSEAGDLDLFPAAAVMADAFANPTVTQIGAHMMGFNGATWDRVETANTGRLQVDVITGGGSPAPPANEVNNTQTEVALAVATPTDIDSAEAASKQLAWIDFWSSADWTADIHTVDNAIESARKGVCGGQAFQHVQYVPSHKQYIATGTTAGADNFRASVTNLGRQAADMHVVFHYED